MKEYCINKNHNDYLNFNEYKISINTIIAYYENNNRNICEILPLVFIEIEEKDIFKKIINFFVNLKELI